jgi:hypothetical protein
MTTSLSPRRPRALGVDVARGACLLIMTLDHLPRHPLGRFSNVVFGPFGFFTALSAFVFLSGLVSAWVYGDALRNEGTLGVWRRVARRACQLYVVNTGILLLLLASTTFGVLVGPDWHDEFPLFFSDPWGALWQGLCLAYRPSYLDILPMYVLFLAITPVALWAIRAGRGWLVGGLSGLVWLLVQVPPLPELSHLNPLAYLVLFVAGLLLGSQRDLGDRLASPAMVRCSKVSLVLAGVLCGLRLGPAILGIGLPHGTLWQTLTDADRNGLIRLANFGLFAMGIVQVWRHVAPRLVNARPLRLVAYLGQHSLLVFVWSVLVTYVSMALMPPSPSLAWRVGDVLLCLGSLVIPAKLDDAIVTSRTPWIRGALAIAPQPAQRRAA